MSSVVIISGSPNPASRLSGLTSYVARALKEKTGIVATDLQVSSLPAEDLVLARWDSPAIEAANRLVAEADAVIVASPVYKASFSGILKTYLDLLPQKGLERKIVMPLFIGGTIAHLLAIEYGLKPILSVLGARRFVSGVYAVDGQVTRAEGADGAGGFVLESDLKLRLDAAVDELIAELRAKTSA